MSTNVLRDDVKDSNLYQIPVSQFFEKRSGVDYVLVLDGYKMYCFLYPENPTSETHYQLVKIHKTQVNGRKDLDPKCFPVANAQDYVLSYQGLIYIFTNQDFRHEFEISWDEDDDHDDSVGS